VNSLLELLLETESVSPPADPTFTTGVTYDPAVTTVAGLAINISTELASDESCIAECAPPASAGVSFAGDYRLITFTTAPAGSDSVVTASFVVAKFGTLVAGMKLFFRLTQVKDGVKGPVGLVSVILT
jgi:hypothetical protein